MEGRQLVFVLCYPIQMRRSKQREKSRCLHFTYGNGYALGELRAFGKERFHLGSELRLCRVLSCRVLGEEMRERGQGKVDGDGDLFIVGRQGFGWRMNVMSVRQLKKRIQALPRAFGSESNDSQLRPRMIRSP